MTASPSDMELLNAFHDGELDPVETRAMEARLRAEPLLRDTLEGIREVSFALRPLGHDLHQNTVRSTQRHVMPGRLLAAAAACLILASAIWLALPRGDVGRSPLDWHLHFAAQSYQPGSDAAPISIGQWLEEGADLSSANLHVVDVARDEGRNVFLHYSGMNGCRLTLGAYSIAPSLPPRSGALLVHGWTSGEAHYSLIADGMDPGRFDAIANLLEERTKTPDQSQDTVVAVRDATRTALPCA